MRNIHSFSLDCVKIEKSISQEYDPFVFTLPGIGVWQNQIPNGNRIRDSFYAMLESWLSNGSQGTVESE